MTPTFERILKTKAVDEFLAKVQSAMSDLEFDLDLIDEDAKRGWNDALKKLTDGILARGVAGISTQAGGDSNGYS